MSGLAERVAIATEHPAAEGAAGCILLVAAFLAPVVGLFFLAERVILYAGAGDPWATAYAFGVLGTFTGVWLFNKVLYGTVVYEWVASFVEWAQMTGLAFGDGEAA